MARRRAMRPSVAVVIAQTPRPPYYVAIITVERSEIDDGYFEMADAMYHAASSQDGFLGMEWVSDAAQRVGITASYWRDAESIGRWKLEAEHLVAQKLGKDRWYDAYRVRIARVERDYEWMRTR
jgi:heme-degrading monooxygenase HmoA